MTAWQRKGVLNLGVREYYSVNTWDRSLPARPRGADLKYLRESIPRFHGLGARFVTAESSDNWGPTGLAYYIAARLMWNVRDAENVQGLVDDFWTKPSALRARPCPNSTTSSLRAGNPALTTPSSSASTA